MSEPVHESVATLRVDADALVRAQPDPIPTFARSPLTDRFLASCEAHAEQVAVQSVERGWQYRELLTLACETAGNIRRVAGFTPGDRVLITLPNSVEYIAAFYGTLLAGGVAVPVAPRMERLALERIYESTRPRCRITPSGTVPPTIRESRHSKKSFTAAEADDRRGRSTETHGRSIPPGLSSALSTSCVVNSLIQQKAEIPDEVRRIRQDREFVHPGGPYPSDNIEDQTAAIPVNLASIFFTGGSTGRPKGVMLSHQNFLANASSIQQSLELTALERPLCVLPFYHAFGNSVLQSHLLCGGTLVLAGNAAFPETLLDALSEFDCTSLAGVPDLFRGLLERSSLGVRPLRSLRAMSVAGGALPQALTLEAARRIAPARFYVMYGQTEATARLAVVDPAELEALPAGCLGRAISGVELQVVDERGTPLPPHTLGELRARGENIMLGYWQDPELTNSVSRDGWLSTGDMVTRDENGRFFHRGRKNSLLKIAGYRIHPAEIEETVQREWLNVQPVVVPFEHPQLGTRLAMFLRSSSEINPPTVLARCRALLPRHLVPDLVVPVDTFPLTDAMKVDRQQLTLLAEQAAGTPHIPSTRQSA